MSSIGNPSIEKNVIILSVNALQQACHVVKNDKHGWVNTSNITSLAIIGYLPQSTRHIAITLYNQACGVAVTVQPGKEAYFDIRMWITALQVKFKLYNMYTKYIIQLKARLIYIL